VSHIHGTRKHFTVTRGSPLCELIRITRQKRKHKDYMQQLLTKIDIFICINRANNKYWDIFAIVTRVQAGNMA
jgi:hypothetical protein